MKNEDPGSNVVRWSSEAFLADAAAWVAKAAAETGVVLNGEHEQPHVRAWSSAVRFGAEDGDLWFKVNARGTRHEGPLLRALFELEPDLVPQVVAVDPERGWSLTRDAGPVMRSIAPPEDLVAPWQVVVARYAEAQIRLARHQEAMLATGVPVVSPATMPGQLRSLVAELSELPADRGGLTGEEQRGLSARYDEFDAWCHELAGSGIPSSIQHDDLHSSNICWTGSAETARIIDWGDASWGFPLGSMLVTVNSLAWHMKCDRDDARVLRVRDAYLERFGEYAERDVLVRYVDLSRRTGCLTRALSYRASLLGEPLATHREEDFPVRDWLLELREA